MIQKASSQKDGLFACTGGHPKSGQTSKEGMICELAEEIGFDATKIPMTCFDTIQDEDSFCDLYFIQADIDLKTLKLQEEEVDSVYFFSWKEIQDLWKRGLFRSSHYQVLLHYFEFHD